MAAIDFNTLMFVWIGLFVAVSLTTAGVVIYFGRKKGRMPVHSGMMLVPYFAIIAAVSLYFCPDLGCTSQAEIIFVIAASFIFAVLGYYNNGKVTKAFSAAAVLASFLFLPTDSFNYPLPLLCIFTAAVIWVWFMYSLFKMNEVDGLVLSEGSFIGFVSFGECWLLTVMMSDSFSGVALVAISFAIALFSFKNWCAYPAKIKLSIDALLPIGFVLGWVLMKLASEGAWMFAVLLPSLFLAESGYALLKKVLFRKEEAVTFAVKAAREGFYHNLIVKHIFKANLVIMVFAAFAPRNFPGLPFVILTFVWVAFEMNKLKNFGQPEPTIRAITKGIFSEFKKGLEQQKEFYTIVSKHYAETHNLKEAFALAHEEIDKAMIAEDADDKPVAESDSEKETEKATEKEAANDDAGDKKPTKKKKATSKKKAKTGNPAQKRKKTKKQV